MKTARWNRARVIAIALGVASIQATTLGQGTLLFVDQASGTLEEHVDGFNQIPDNRIAQSFTPSFSAVGYVQLRVAVFAVSSGETLVIHLRQGAYEGPIVSSTTPALVVSKIADNNTFYFPDNVPVTPGQLYFFEPVLLSGGDLLVGSKNPSSYSGGDEWNNGFQGTGDYWFREGVVGVPEPGTVGLLLLGLGALFWQRRQRDGSP